MSDVSNHTTPDEKCINLWDIDANDKNIEIDGLVKKSSWESFFDVDIDPKLKSNDGSESLSYQKLLSSELMSDDDGYMVANNIHDYDDQVVVDREMSQNNSQENNNLNIEEIQPQLDIALNIEDNGEKDQELLCKMIKEVDTYNSELSSQQHKTFQQIPDKNEKNDTTNHYSINTNSRSNDKLSNSGNYRGFIYCTNKDRNINSKECDKEEQVNTNKIDINSLSNYEHNCEDAKINKDFRTEDIVFESDMNSIFEQEACDYAKKLMDDYNFANNTDRELRGINRMSQNFDMLDERNKDIKVEEDHITINENFIEELAKIVSNNERFHMLESKMDHMTDILLKNATNIRVEVLETKTPAYKIQNGIEQKPFMHSGVRTKHHHITCNNCKLSEFIGKRYKCLECLDYDFCEQCEATISHDHPLIRIIVPVSGSAFKDLNRCYIVKQAVLNRSEAELKENFLRSITDNNYNDTLYKQLLTNYKEVNVEMFIIEMTKIFG